METQYISLNMTPTGVNPCFHISQYDVGRMLGFIVHSGGATVDLDTYTCTIEATRSDGTAITSAVATTDNIGTFEVTPTMSNKADKYRCQLIIVDENSKRIASLPFDMEVTKAAMDENSEAIEEDASLYQQYTEAVQGAIAEANADIQAEENARIAAVNAEATARQNADATLQNNIDAEATARQTADNTLQGNINSEASTRASADSNLQSQINQIIAPSGEAPSAAEVENARIGADGAVYETLGDAIRTQNSNLKSAINKISGDTLLEFTNPSEKKYINTNVEVGASVSLTPETATSNLCYAVASCSEGDVFTLYGTGGNKGRLWAFIDSNNLLLSKSEAYVIINGLIVKAPANASKIIVNFNGGGIAYKGKNELDKTYASLLYNVEQLNESQIDETVRVVSECAVWEKGSIRGSTGQDNNNGHNARTIGYIDINGLFGNYTIYPNSDVDIGFAAYYYDENKNFISSQGGTAPANTNIVYTFPASAKYVRFMAANKDWGILSDLSIPHKIIIKAKIGYRKINPPAITFIRGGYSSGVEIDSTTRIVNNDYIPVGAGTKMTNALGQCLSIGLFDSNLNYLSNSGWVVQYTFDSDCFARIILRYSANNEELTDQMVTEVTDNFRIWYQPPTSEKITQSRLDGTVITDPFDFKTTENLLSNQLWEQGGIDSATGENQRTGYTIRTRHYIAVKDLYALFAPQRTETEYANIIFNLLYYDSEKQYIRNSLINDLSSRSVNFIMPEDAAYIRIGVKKDNNITILTDTTFARNVVLMYKENADIILANDPVSMQSKLRQLKYHRQPQSVVPISILWYSDLHHNLYNFGRIYKFREQYKEFIDATIQTGDLINNHLETMDFFTDNHTLNVIGNHDTWDGADDWQYLDEKEAYDTFIAPFVSNWGVTYTADHCYYYKDFASGNIRLICLDCMHDTQAQVSWFENALAGAKTNGYDVIIANHVQPAQNPDLVPLETPWHNSIVYNGNLEWIDSFPRWTPQAYRDAVDAFIANGGTVACWISGHRHSDICGVWHNILSVSVTTAGDTGSDRSYENRERYGRQQDAFNIIAVDSVYKIVKIVRVGQDYSVGLQHVDTFCWDYANHKMIPT